MKTLLTKSLVALPAIVMSVYSAAILHAGGEFWPYPILYWDAFLRKQFSRRLLNIIGEIDLEIFDVTNSVQEPSQVRSSLIKSELAHVIL
jgi:hypothetical protein